jgi:molybdopterin synthase sulfur carrier subunit
MVEVHAFATLKKHLPEGGKAELEIEPGATVDDLARRLDIPINEVKIVMRNGRHVELRDTVHDGDRVAFFPAVGGG